MKKPEISKFDWLITATIISVVLIFAITSIVNTWIEARQSSTFIINKP